MTESDDDIEVLDSLPPASRSRTATATSAGSAGAGASSLTSRRSSGGASAGREEIEAGEESGGGGSSSSDDDLFRVDTRKLRDRFQSSAAGPTSRAPGSGVAAASGAAEVSRPRPGASGAGRVMSVIDSSSDDSGEEGEEGDDGDDSFQRKGKAKAPATTNPKRRPQR